MQLSITTIISENRNTFKILINYKTSRICKLLVVTRKGFENKSDAATTYKVNQMTNTTKAHTQKTL